MINSKELQGMKITSRWKTLATIGFNGSVSRYENRMAHGGVCHLQVRKNKDKVIGRKVNTNGWHEEMGESFDLDMETLKHWFNLSKCMK